MSMYQAGFNVGKANEGMSIGDLLRGAVEQATKRETKRTGKAVLLTWQFEGTWVQDAEGYPVMRGTFKPAPHIFVNETRGTSETVVARAKARQEYLRIWRNLADNGVVCSVHDAESFAFVVDSFEYVKTRGLQASQTVQINGSKRNGVKTETQRTFQPVTPTMQGAFGPVQIKGGEGRGTVIGIPPGPEAAQVKRVETTDAPLQLTGTVGDTDAIEGEVVTQDTLCETCHMIPALPDSLMCETCRAAQWAAEDGTAEPTPTPRKRGKKN